jgi:intracellular sulfur oxidation DsrE/DsrF family protein
MSSQPWAIVISQNGLCEEAQEGDIYELLAMLEETEHPPVRLYFTTEGVSLVASGSPILTRLQKLEANGLEMIACRTCLDYMGLRDCVQVGHIRPMEHIMSDMESTCNVVVL